MFIISATCNLFELKTRPTIENTAQINLKFFFRLQNCIEIVIFSTALVNEYSIC